MARDPCGQEEIDSNVSLKRPHACTSQVHARNTLLLLLLLFFLRLVPLRTPDPFLPSVGAGRRRSILSTISTSAEVSHVRKHADLLFDRSQSWENNSLSAVFSLLRPIQTSDSGISLCSSLGKRLSRENGSSGRFFRSARL